MITITNAMHLQIAYSDKFVTVTGKITMEKKKLAYELRFKNNYWQKPLDAFIYYSLINYQLTEKETK